MKTIMALVVAVILAFSCSSAVFAASHGNNRGFNITKQLILAEDEPAPSPDPPPNPGPEEPK